MEKVNSVNDSVNEDEIEEEVKDLDDVEVDLAYLECFKDEATEAATKLLVPLNELDKELVTFYETLKVKLQRNKVAVESILGYNQSEHPTQSQTNHDKQKQTYAKSVKRECEYFENMTESMHRLRMQIIRTREYIKSIDIEVLEEDKSGIINEQNDEEKYTDKKKQSIYMASDEVKDNDEFSSEISFEQSSSSFIDSRSGTSSENASVSNTHKGVRAKTQSKVILYEPLNDSLQTNPRISGSSLCPIKKDSSISLPATTDQNHTAHHMLEPERSNVSQIDVRGIHKQMRKSREKPLLYRGENIKHFLELQNSIASPSPALSVQSLSRTGSVKARFGNVDTGNGSGNTNDKSKMVICKRYNITDRNWIDVKLFPQYYLVVIQKKEAKAGNNEFLNKYNKRTGELMAWLWLPGAGRMCKIDSNGMVAVLQVGGKSRHISVVNTCKHEFNGTAHELRKLYQIPVSQAYIVICSFAQAKSDDMSTCRLKFAVVHSVLEKGKMEEEIDILDSYVTIRSDGKAKIATKNSCITRRGGICSIDTLGADKIVISLIYSIVCVDTRGRDIWVLPTDARVTDICCREKHVFACVYNKGRIMKILARDNNWVIEENNILSNEEIKPSQVSVCGQEILIREFILEEYKSQVIVRVMKL